MKVTRGDTVARQTVLHIEVEPERVDKHLHRAYQRLVQTTRVPGFRPGKAPRTVFERHVGKDRLLEEALESLVPEAVTEALKSESLTPAATPRVSVVEKQPVVKLDATIALEPQVTLGDYRSIKIVRDETAVSDKDVDDSIERVRDAQATWAPVERELKLGDLATITAAGHADGKQVLNAQSTEFLAAEGIAYPVKGFAEAIAGMKVGETREFPLTFPEDHSQKALAGKQGQFTATLHGLKEKVLPAVDDELAKSVGEGFQTLAELRNRIRGNLVAQARENTRLSVERQLLDSLVAGAAFEVPPMMVEHETDHIIYDTQQELARYKLPLEQYIQRSGKSAEEYVNDTRATAEDRLKRSLVIEKLAEAEGIVVTDDEVSAEIATIRSGGRVSPEQLDSAEAKDSVRRTLRRRAALNRAFELAGVGNLISQDGAAGTALEGAGGTHSHPEAVATP